MKLTAMTYNIFSGRNLRRDLNLAHAASVIRRMQPDFVTLNEVRSHTEDVGEINQAYELGRLTGYYPVFARAIDILGGEYGNGFLSRLPVIETEIIHIPDPDEKLEGCFYEHRCILRCVLLAGERNITVFSSHFGLAPNEQVNAVDTVLALIEKETNPVLLLGDLNAQSDAREMQPLFASMKDASEGAGILTFPSDKPTHKIDHILYKGDWNVLNVCSMDTQCSDHRPLIAELAL